MVLHLVDDAPIFVGLLILVLLLWVFRKELRRVIPNLRVLRLPGGIEAEFQEAVAKASEDKDTELPAGERSRLARRAAREAESLKGTRVLWLDDDHEQTEPERQAMEALGVVIRTADSNKNALSALAANTFDLMISDLNRNANPEAGINFARQLRAQHHALPIVFYVGSVDPDKPVPKEASGLTNRPDELLHLVMDITARQRG